MTGGRLTTALRLLLPAFLLGAMVAISFLEAPLKFSAPGVTIPIGLGIGRLVFTALNVLAGVVLLVLTVVTVRARAGRTVGVLLTAIWVVFAVEVAVIRPVLNRRSDLVIAGSAAPGTDGAHYAYIAADTILVVLLVALTIVTVRSVLPGPAATPAPGASVRSPGPRGTDR